MPLNAVGDFLNAILAQAVAPPPPVVMEPEKVAVEMIGRTFVLTEPFTSGGTTLATGSEVQVRAWSNTSETVTCARAAAPAVTFNIPKRQLLPKRAPVAGIHPYSAGARGQAAVVKKAETTLAAWLAREDEYKRAGTTAEWVKERDRQLGLLVTRRKALNRKLIQETMFNRFDGAIKAEVDRANAAAGLSGANALDANLLKSMFFQESQLGTAGEHLEDPPSVEEKSRFNLGQVIDSSGIAFLTLFEKQHPALITTYRLGSIRTDLVVAQKRHEELGKKASRTPAEEAEFSILEEKAENYWDTFIWQYRAAGSPVGFQEAVLHFYGTSVPSKHLDYGFWIFMAVFWLFEKKRSASSWAAAIRAYNGGGARATRYRDEVVQRAADAAAAAKAGRDFIPRES